MRRRALKVSSTPSISAIAASIAARTDSADAVAVARRLQAAQHAGQRLAQVVGDIGADLLVGDEQLLDPVEQAVEGARERGQIVVYRARAESDGSSRRP